MQHVSHQHASQRFTDTENAKTDTGLMSIRISKYGENEEAVGECVQYVSVCTDVNYRE